MKTLPLPLVPLKDLKSNRQVLYLKKKGYLVT